MNRVAALLLLSIPATSSVVISVDKKMAHVLYDAIPDAAADCFLSREELVGDPEAARVFESFADAQGAASSAVEGIRLTNCVSRRQLQSGASPKQFCVPTVQARNQTPRAPHPTGEKRLAMHAAWARARASCQRPVDSVDSAWRVEKKTAQEKSLARSELAIYI